MAPDPLQSPVVVDGRLSDEKLAELRSLRTEYRELDFKTTVDLSETAGKVEFAKDVGAMQVFGGYIIVGVDNDGTPTGILDETDLGRFDEARLAPTLLKWLPEPLELRTRIAEQAGHTIVGIYVGRHPSGCAVFKSDGQYSKDGKEVVAFRAGEVFWRDGTRSVRISQRGFEAVIARRLADERSSWLEEQRRSASTSESSSRPPTRDVGSQSSRSGPSTSTSTPNA